MTLSDVIAQDAAAYGKHSPDVIIEDRPQVRTAGGATAVVRQCRGATGGPFEAMAYFDEPNVVVILILSARSRETFESAQPAFRQLLESYKFMGEWERMPNGEPNGKPRP